MDKIRIPRSGKAAITFEGELVVGSDGKHCNGKDQNRWHDLALYRTVGGNFVVHVEYVTQWQGEVGWSEAEQVSPDKVEEFFRGYDPCKHVQGFPPSEKNVERQANLLNWIRTRYDAQVAEILDMCPEADEVVE